ncbi:MAG TPA: SLC13 family permease [Chloroflexi bacterium]|nr:SLC13 family permease [Chloroflexota bacterium]
MNTDILLTFAILAAATLFFITEWLRADVVALMVLVAVVVSGLVTPQDAIAGFGNSAVVTIWAVYILSAGLARTGVATMLGRQVVRLSGKSEKGLMSVLIVSTALVTSVMNINGAAAMFLPVTINIARRTKRAASRLLMPMAYGALLGGMLVLFGTSSNLVVSGYLYEAGLPPLEFFSFTPIGLVILAAVLMYMNVIGHRLLPQRQTPQSSAARNGNGEDLHSLYGIEERLALLTIPAGNPLVGMTINESRIGHTLGLTVLRIKRANGHRYSPTTDMKLEAGDRLLALGRLDQLNQLTQARLFDIEEDVPALDQILSNHIYLAEFRLSDQSPLLNQTLASIDFRRMYQVNVIAIRRGKRFFRTRLNHIPLQQGDYLLLEGQSNHLEAFSQEPDFRMLTQDKTSEYHLSERLLFITIPEGSALAGKSLQEVRLGEVYGISVLTIQRGLEEWTLSKADTELAAGDRMIVSGHPTDIDALDGLRNLSIEVDVDVKAAELEYDDYVMVEVILSPHGSLGGKTLQDIHFREKFGISVLAIWHGDRPYRTALSDLPLQNGDGLLCYGRRERFALLAKEPDFVVMRMDVQEQPRLDKAPVAAVIMVAVIGLVISRLLPISIAAIAGAAMMVITGCLDMDEAYRAINWKAIFILGSMLSLGMAMQQSGAAQFLANGVISTIGDFGVHAILGGIMLLTLVLNALIPGVVNAVIMTPIAMVTATNLGVSPLPFVMGIAYMVASSFMTPVSHAANMLVMSPGGYRYTDYVKNGIPIALIVFVVSFLMMPFVFPF